MLPTAIDIIAILLLVLPGFLAYRFVVNRRVDPTQRSPLWEISEIVEHSVFVHIGGILLSAIVVWILKSVFGVTTHAHEIFQIRPHDFLGKYLAEGVLWITLYFGYVIFASSLIGAYDAPGKVSSGIIRLVSISSTWLHKKQFLHWVPVPKYAYPPEPIWYYAVSRLRDEYESETPIVIVTLKNGGIYVGEIDSYPIVSDTASEKDFLLRKVSYFKNDDIYKDELEPHVLDEGIDAVLLNTVNVLSIRLYFNNSAS